MSIDPNILLQSKSMQLDNPLEVAGKAYTLKNLVTKSQIQDREENDAEASSQLMKKYSTVDANGNINIDRGSVVKDGFSQNPRIGMLAQQLVDKHGKEQADYMTEQAGRIYSGVSDQASWDAARPKLEALGLPNVQQLPEFYTPQVIRNGMIGSMGVKDYLAQMKSDEDSASKQKQQEIDNNFKAQELGIKNKEAGAKLIKEKSDSKAMSVAQSKQMGLYNSGAEAEKQYVAATSKKGWNSFDPSSNSQWVDKNDWAPNFLKSDESKEAHSAQDRWIEAFLRDASGAAIPPSERGAYAKDFFPMAGDSAQVVSDKARARQLKMEGAKLAATGRPEAAGSNDPAMAKVINGTTYRKVDGGWLPAE